MQYKKCNTIMETVGYIMKEVNNSISKDIEKTHYFCLINKSSAIRGEVIYKTTKYLITQICRIFIKKGKGIRHMKKRKDRHKFAYSIAWNGKRKSTS